MTKELLGKCVEERSSGHEVVIAGDDKKTTRQESVTLRRNKQVRK